jgi:hypothetical protein
MKKDSTVHEAAQSFCSGMDLPSELTVTIDNNLQNMMHQHQSVHKNMKSMQ